MDSKLDEYCLSHIFSYLKLHDLIHVSQVCQLWKQVAQRKWQKVTEIAIYEYDNNDEKAVAISAPVAKKIFSHAAQFVRVIRVFDENKETLVSLDEKCGYFMFGNHCYKLEESFDRDTILEVLIRNCATEVIEASFNYTPKADLMRSFLQKNKVKKLRYDDFAGYHQHIPTDGIEDLTINFRSANKNFHSFEGHFPNLKKLDLNIENEDYDVTQIRQILSKIFPHVVRITSLRLTVTPSIVRVQSYDMLNGIFRLSQLEELFFHVTFENDDNKVGDTFLSILWACCPKIRVLDIDISADFYIKGLQSLMLLPDLEVLNVKLPWRGFPLMELSELKNLSSLKLTFTSRYRTAAGIFEAVKMMPKLQNIDFNFTDEISEESQLQFICRMVRAAILIGKDVLLFKLDLDEDDKTLKVERKTRPQNVDRHERRQTLHFRFHFFVTQNEKELFRGVREFVRNQLRDYHAFILENDRQE